MGVRQEITIGVANMGYTPAGNPRLPVPILPVTRTYKGTLLAGSSYSIHNLIPGLTMGETVLIQTGAGSGDLRLGSVAGEGVLFVQGFTKYNLGTIVAQDGWLLDAGASSLDAVNVGGERMVGNPALAIGAFADLHRPLDTVIGAAGPYRARWRIYRGANTPAINSIISVTMQDTTLALPQWSVTLDTMGTLNVVALATYTPGVGLFPAGWHDFEITVSAAGILLCWIDNALVLTSSVIAGSGFPRHIQINHDGGGPAIVPANYFLVDDFQWVASTLPTTGMLIESGAGERLEAQLNPIDLNDLGIAPAAGGAAGLVEILVVGR